jgi:hypothetical protein
MLAVILLKICKLEIMIKKFIAHSYLETTMEQTDEKILVATLQSLETGTIRFVVPIDSQIAKRVKFYVNNGIKDYLEKDLVGDYDLINLNDFTLSSQRNRDNQIESIYFHNSISTRPSSNKIICKESLSLLEKAFGDLTSEAHLYNSNIICHLKSDDGEANVYLAGKFLDEEKFIAILETEFSLKRELQIMTWAQIRELGVFSEFSNKPFSIKEYIETGQKIYY